MRPPFPRLLCLLFVSGWLARAAAQAPAAPAGPGYPLEAYAAVGSAFGKNTRLADIGMTEEQFNAFIEGLRATFRGRPLSLDARATQLHDEIGRRVQGLVERETGKRQADFADPKQLEAYMKEMVKNFRLQRSDSGLAYGLISTGDARPGPDDTVVISCEVVAADMQTELKQLRLRERRVKVSDLLPGVAEGIQMLAVNGTAMLVVPPELSYASGEWPAGVAPAPLLFTVKLHGIIPVE
jgi:FKBP-type peptidyl-prolyl cis-trans isomerase